MFWKSGHILLYEACRLGNVRETKRAEGGIFTALVWTNSLPPSNKKTPFKVRGAAYLPI